MMGGGVRRAIWLILFVLEVEYQANLIQVFVLVILLRFLGLLLFLNLVFNSFLHLRYGELVLDSLLCQLSFKVSELFLKFEDLFLLDQVFQLLDAFTG